MRKVAPFITLLALVLSCGKVLAFEEDELGKIALAYAREAGTHRASLIAQQVTKLAEKLLSQTRRPALCHNDLVYSNIIGGETVRLIDWEYSDRPR